jgi:hypothetical protein
MRGNVSSTTESLSLFDEIIQTRRQLADLLGFNSYSEMSSCHRILKTPKEVLSFLDVSLTLSIEYQFFCETNTVNCQISRHLTFSLFFHNIQSEGFMFCQTFNIKHINGILFM